MEVHAAGPTPAVPKLSGAWTLWARGLSVPVGSRAWGALPVCSPVGLPPLCVSTPSEHPEQLCGHVLHALLGTPAPKPPTSWGPGSFADVTPAAAPNRTPGGEVSGRCQHLACFRSATKGPSLSSEFARRALGGEWGAAAPVPRKDTWERSRTWGRVCRACPFLRWCPDIGFADCLCCFCSGPSSLRGGKSLF